MSDWIKLHRALNDNPLWLLEPFTKAQAWVDLCLNANWKPGAFEVRGNIVHIGRGQIGWSEVTMASRWKWSRNKVRRFLSYLEENEYMEQQKTGVTTIITICNYDTYQSKVTAEEQQKDIRGTSEGQQKDIRRASEGHQAIHNIRREEGKEGEEGNKEESKKCFAPPSRQEAADFFIAKGSTADDAASFYYHFAEREWTLSNRKKMKSWELSAQKWIHNSKNFSSNGKSNGKPKTGSSASEWQAAFDSI